MRGITLILLGLVAACQSPPSTQEWNERLLATIPPGVQVTVPVAFSTDGRVAAYVADTPDGDWVVKGDWRSRRLDAI